MNFKVISSYMEQSNKNDWNPNWKGIDAFQKQIYQGIRCSETYKFIWDKCKFNDTQKVGAK